MDENYIKHHILWTALVSPMNSGSWKFLTSLRPLASLHMALESNSDYGTTGDTSDTWLLAANKTGKFTFS